MSDCAGQLNAFREDAKVAVPVRDVETSASGAVVFAATDRDVIAWDAQTVSACLLLWRRDAMAE